MRGLDILPERLLPWFRINQRNLPWRRDRNPYHIWISEIMLQQTRVEAVKGYYPRFIAGIPDIAALAEISESELLKYWEGLGYYSRARNLQKAAQMIVEHYRGVFPSGYSDILSLPGIGDYTAGAIASICFDLRIPAVDGNVLRVISRYSNDHRCVDDNCVKRSISQMLAEIYPVEAGEFTQALMELGAIVCIPHGAPKCNICPLADVCQANLCHTAEKLPIRRKRQTRKQQNLTVFLLTCGDMIAVRKRPQAGLLAGLYEFPNCPGTMTVEKCIAEAELWGVQPQFLEKLVGRKHIFTHIQWNMTGVRLHCGRVNSDFVWIDRATLQESIPLPTAFRQFLKDI